MIRGFGRIPDSNHHHLGCVYRRLEGRDEICPDLWQVMDFLPQKKLKLERFQLVKLFFSSRLFFGWINKDIDCMVEKEGDPIDDFIGEECLFS